MKTAGTLISAPSIPCRAACGSARPSAWEFQVSTGHLKEPEALEPGNVQRTTTSGSWFKRDGDDFTAVTVGYGVNATRPWPPPRGVRRGHETCAASTPFMRGARPLQVEIATLVACPVAWSHVRHAVHCVDEHRAAMRSARSRWVASATSFGRRGFEGGFGAAATFYAVPDAARLRPTENTRFRFSSSSGFVRRRKLRADVEYAYGSALSGHLGHRMPTP